MKKKRIVQVIIWWLSAMIGVSKSLGQTVQNDSLYLQNAITQTTANYNKAIGQQSRLFNGSEYLSYERHIKGNALYPLDASAFDSGIVTYDGITYKNVPMMYDIYKDVVVVQLYNKFSMFTPITNRVHDFTLRGLYFVRVEADSVNTNSSGISTGFYQQLYGGKIEVLAKRIKTIQSAPITTLNDIETYFVAKNDYYLRKGTIYYSIGGQSSFLKLLKDKKSQLQQYIKDNKIKFKKDPEAAMAKIAAYYDQLAN